MSGDNFARRYSVVTETRRRWSESEKQAVVVEAKRPGVNISAVVRRHGIKPSLLFRWRRLARDGQDRQSTSVFIPVTLTLPAVEPPAPEASAEADVPPPPAASREPEPDAHRIEIALGNGRVVRVGAGVDVDSLRRILDVADGR